MMQKLMLMSKRASYIMTVVDPVVYVVCRDEESEGEVHQ